MPLRIKIRIQDISLDAELADTPCAQAIAAALPIESTPNEWGDEFYFEVPVALPLDATATTSVLRLLSETERERFVSTVLREEDESY